MSEEFALTEKKHYPSLDGFRVISCIGIMMMHIQANTYYQLDGFVWSKIIPSFTHLVLLFIMISGFGMCVGYLKRFHNETVDLEKFYKRRYSKILPYFCFLIVIAFLYEPSVTNFYDATMEFLLVYGLLPNNALNVIGVGWTLGVIFLFYFLFPAFSILLKSKRRAWIFLFVTLWINFVCTRHYFSSLYVTELFIPRHAFIWCLPVFMGGGLLYLYRKEIATFCNKFRYLVVFFCLLCTALYFIIPSTIMNFDIAFYKDFILYALWMFYAIGVDSNVFGNKIMKFLSGISLEIYLSHMFVFRFMEKLNVQYLFGEESWLSYVTLCLLTLVGLFALIFGYKLAVKVLKDKIFCGIMNKGGGYEQ